MVFFTPVKALSHQLSVLSNRNKLYSTRLLIIQNENRNLSLDLISGPRSRNYEINSSDFLTSFFSCCNKIEHVMIR